MITDSNSEISGLRSQLFIQLVALVLVTGTLMVYLYRQSSIEGKQLAQNQLVLNNYKQLEPKINVFVSQLVAYGQRHPDFAQTVLKKYGIVPQPGGVPYGSTAPRK
jgi:hypothetical protein